MPMGDYADWEDCVRKTHQQHPEWSKDRCERYCGAIKHRVEDSDGRRGGRGARRRQHGR